VQPVGFDEILGILKCHTISSSWFYSLTLAVSGGENALAFCPSAPVLMSGHFL
jgi:hypothetical protein